MTIDEQITAVEFRVEELKAEQCSLTSLRDEEQMKE